MPKITLIGYWRSDDEPEWPDPTDFIDLAWDRRERQGVAMYLDNGTVPWVQAGVSECRICGAPNGSAEFTDGVYLWPEGLSHYVREHVVRLPRSIVEHIHEADKLRPWDVDKDWWKVARPDW